MCEDQLHPFWEEALKCKDKRELEVLIHRKAELLFDWLIRAYPTRLEKQIKALRGKE